MIREDVLEAMKTRWISPQVVVTNRIDAPGYQELRQFGRTVIGELELGTTPTHMEWFAGDKGLYFSEIGARPPGCRVWDLYCHANDMDMYVEWARAVVHGNAAPRPSRRFAAGLIALRPSQDGVYAGYTGVEEIRQRYGDFILEFEFQVAPDMNSGVQFRSEYYTKETEAAVNGKKKKFPADRVFGYQYEIDPSPRAYTAGVYDEARRGWLAELKGNEAAQKAFKAGGWNLARIECQGDHIQTWINGVKAADLKDAMTLKGIIALQVHGIGDGIKKKPGEEIRWRNIRLKPL